MNQKEKNLHKLFRDKGACAKKYIRECIGMLPEIYKLRIYEKKNFGSIYEYAAKLAGISRLQVDTVLRLERRFEDKPALKKALVFGEVSHHKLAKVASIATPDNAAELVEKTKQLPSRALEVFVQDVRSEAKYAGSGTSVSEYESDVSSDTKNENSDGSNKPQIEQKSLHVQTFELDEDVEKELAELQEKGIDVNEFLRECLKKRKLEITEEKEKLSKETKPTKSTYIKVKIKKVLKKEHGTKCSIPGCNRPSVNIHHTRRFSISHTHDPKYLAPLCKEHHQIAHAVDQKVSGYRQIAHEVKQKESEAGRKSTSAVIQICK